MVETRTDPQSSWKVRTYYEEDKSLLISEKDSNLGTSILTTKVEDHDAYQKPIFVTPRPDGGYDIGFHGLLYTQCGGPNGACAVQGYKIQLDECGKVLGFESPSRWGYQLLAYAPNEPDLHLPLDKQELDRLVHYANSPEILEAIYPNIAGQDQKSHYILGTSIPTGAIASALKNTIASGWNPYRQLGSGTRWQMNPWATNTVATFLIHLDIIRKFIERHGKVPSSCLKWPRFQGQTPLPQKPVDLSQSQNFLDDRIEVLGKELTDWNTRIENFKIEEVIARQITQAKADNSPCLIDTLAYPAISPAFYQVNQDYSKIVDRLEDAFPNIGGWLENGKLTSKALTAKAILGDVEIAQSSIQETLKLKSLYQKTWKHKMPGQRLSKKEKKPLYDAFIKQINVYDFYAFEFVEPIIAARAARAARLQKPLTGNFFPDNDDVLEAVRKMGPDDLLRLKPRRFPSSNIGTGPGQYNPVNAQLSEQAWKAAAGRLKRNWILLSTRPPASP